MSRRRQAVKRPVLKDAKFNSTLVSRLVNTVMERGKKTVAQRIVYGAFDQIAEKNPATNPMDVLQRAVDNAKPRLEVKARRVGGDRESTRLNSSHVSISYAVFCLKKKKQLQQYWSQIVH